MAGGKGPGSTSERLLDHASRIFAERGYRDATIAEICEAAGANIAAVNYHFGDKERLYEQVWQRGLKEADARHPLDGGLEADAPADELLEAFIHAMIHRSLEDGPGSTLARVMVKELVEPTNALGDMMTRFILPVAEYLNGILRRVVPEADTDERLLFCRVSIVSQCLFLNFTRAIRARMLGRIALTPEEIGALADHTTRFSLAGLGAVRSQWKAGRT